MAKTLEELKKEFRKKFVSDLMFDDGNNTMLWNDKAPTPNEMWNWMEQAIKEAREEIPFGEPLSTYIQWKGTDLCMDWYCIHGHQNHFDGDFAYTVTCEKCSEVYELGESVSLKLS